MTVGLSLGAPGDEEMPVTDENVSRETIDYEEAADAGVGAVKAENSDVLEAGNSGLTVAEVGQGVDDSVREGVVDSGREGMDDSGKNTWDADAASVDSSPAMDATSMEPPAMELEQPTEAVRELFGTSFGAIAHFATMLEEEGELRGLIGPREVPRLWSRHLVNSAALLDFIPSRAQVLDIGSGAGFPGLVIAIARPDVDVHLVEPMTRRCEWLADVVEEIALDNVTIHEAQAQQLRGMGQADIVTARAVANVRKLLPICMPLVQPGGRVLALKGRRVHEEVQAAESVFVQHAVASYRVHEVPSVMEDESTMVLELIKARDQRQGRRGKRGGDGYGSARGAGAGNRGAGRGGSRRKSDSRSGASRGNSGREKKGRSKNGRSDWGRGNQGRGN